MHKTAFSGYPRVKSIEFGLHQMPIFIGLNAFLRFIYVVMCVQNTIFWHFLDKLYAYVIIRVVKCVDANPSGQRS